MKTKINIALFDESPGDYNLILEFMLQSDYNIDLTWIRTGHEAAEYIPVLASSKIHKVDLIISETNIPGAACSDIISEIRKHETLANVPIIIFTNFIYPGDIVTFLNKHITNMFLKPMNVDEYKAVVEKMLNTIVLTQQADTNIKLLPAQ